MASITPISRDQFNFIAQICVPLNIISLISSIASCMTFGFIRIYYPNLADRVSFRLSFAALFCDIGYSVHILILLGLDVGIGFSCIYTVWGVVFFGLTSLFFIVCIALVCIMILFYCSLHMYFICLSFFDFRIFI
ncbi:hypothetical protein C2G38_1693453 [Gigaspora rosea]|uniref:G-protein coupled receptors family 1 profile domain-containing protein n=1 Tax=Gigaspora rosea TaxID=44941 RepID=A0A397UUW9_9GLOM|nr:hypothetical protein C2G38_1693453 [Gigaspora rosea]